MSTNTERQDGRERSWIYITAAVLLGVALLLAVLTVTETRESNRAQEKADELVAAFEEAGLATPDRDVVVHLFGDDGGATCDDPNGALRRATLAAQLGNGASGPGARPVIVDRRVLQGQLLVLEVYCPDELEDFRGYVEDLATDDVLGD